MHPSDAPADGEELHGGWSHPGAILRVGDEVRRPALPGTATHMALATHILATGERIVPEPRGVDQHGRARWEFIDGEVMVDGHWPAWSRTEATVASVGGLLRRFHDATSTFDAPADAVWDPAMVPTPGPTIGHNDACPENVVFRDGLPVAFIDLDLAGPTHHLTDLAAMAYMWSQMVNERRSGPGTVPYVAAAARGYGLDRVDPSDFHSALLAAIAQCGRFARRRAESGVEPFVTSWREVGGQAEYDRRIAWWDSQRDALLAALHG